MSLFLLIFISVSPSIFYCDITFILLNFNNIIFNVLASVSNAVISPFGGDEYILSKDIIIENIISKVKALER